MSEKVSELVEALGYLNNDIEQYFNGNDKFPWSWVRVQLDKFHGTLTPAIEEISALRAENDRLRAVINSHAQSGCMCQFCRDARKLAESKDE
jgi:hypothetical protein